MATNFPFNVLGAVQSVIGKQEYLYQEFTGRALNSRGQYYNTYGEAATRLGSIQALRTKQIALASLDMTQTYIKILDTELVKILSRSDNAGRVTYDGYYYRPIPEGASDWSTQGGWNRVICVREDKIDG